MKKQLVHIILICVALVLSSACSTLKRVLSKDLSDSCPSIETIRSQYSPSYRVEEMWYECSVPGPTRRRALVYLPDGYNASGAGYPVLYLIHGARGNELSWIKDGNLFPIVDTLYRRNLIKAQIIVLVNCNEYDNDADFDYSRFKKPFESYFEIDGAVESSFINDVVSSVDSRYNTIRDKSGRAIAGLSVGAMQAMYITAGNPDCFDYIGLFSPFSKAPIRKSDYSSFYDNLLAKQKIQFQNCPPKLYFIAIGRNDIFYPHVEYLRMYLSRKKFPYEYMECGGGHDWFNWSAFLIEFLQKIF